MMAVCYQSLLASLPSGSVSLERSLRSSRRRSRLVEMAHRRSSHLGTQTSSRISILPAHDEKCAVRMLRSWNMDTSVGLRLPLHKCRRTPTESGPGQEAMQSPHILRTGKLKRVG
jgi:hypothetical protein